MIFVVSTLIVLLAAGIYLGSFSGLTGCLLFTGVVIGAFVVRLIGWHPATSTVAIAAVDIALVLVIFKGDLRIRG